MTCTTDPALAELRGRFSWVDYLVFALMLSLSAAIGIFYGFISKRKQDTKEFLMAGKSMTTFPVAMSLIASFMSAITLLGAPSEVYSTGFIYWLMGMSYFVVIPIVIYFYLPVFWELQVTSAYEYLELRFHSSVRLLGSFIFIIQMSLYMAIVIYAPSLALAQVTGINLYLSVSLISFVCIFYTTLGGMKAVLWTDALQVVIMYGMIFFIIFKGLVDEGGFSKVWEIASQGNRATLVDWDLRPTTRHTFWSLTIGGAFIWLYVYAVNQAQVQRYLCVKEKKMAINALWINLIGLSSLMFVCAIGGLVIFAKYSRCDPRKSKMICASDQLLPLYVMDTLGTWNGIPGLFVAGIFSGALSTVSSGMNSLAAITLEDFVKGLCFPNMSERASTIASKGLSFFYGILTFGLVFVAEQLGDILSAALSVYGIIGGPLLGLFSLGMFVPWANAKGAIVGTITSICIALWIGIGYQAGEMNRTIQPFRLPVDTSGCSALNLTVIPDPPPIIEDDSALTQLYKTSYLWYSPIAFTCVLIFGTLVSFLTSPTDLADLNPKLISPPVRYVLSRIPGIPTLGVNYDEMQEIQLKNSKSAASMGTTNMVFNESFSKSQDSNMDNIPSI